MPSPPLIRGVTRRLEGSLAGAVRQSLDRLSLSLSLRPPHQSHSFHDVFIIAAAASRLRPSVRPSEERVRGEWRDGLLGISFVKLLRRPRP